MSCFTAVSPIGTIGLDSIVLVQQQKTHRHTFWFVFRLELFRPTVLHSEQFKLSTKAVGRSVMCSPVTQFDLIVSLSEEILHETTKDHSYLYQSYNLFKYMLSYILNIYVTYVVRHTHTYDSSYALLYSSYFTYFSCLIVYVVMAYCIYSGTL